MAQSQGGIAKFIAIMHWCFSIPESSRPAAPFLIKSALLQVEINEKAKAQSNLDGAVLYFIRNFWKIQTARGWPNRMLEFLLKVISPGVWTYYAEFITQQLAISQFSNSTSGFDWAGLAQHLSKTPLSLDVGNVNWKSREQVRKVSENARAIMAAIDQQLEDLRFIDGDFY